MDKIKVSILVTFYNQESYVDTALEGIFSQNVNFKYQVLIGDDGSSDNTISIIQKWMKKYPDIIELYIMSRENGVMIPGFRASQNRLNLLEHVKGEYFIFLDGDDYFTDVNKLQQQVDILDNPEHMDCIACAHNIELLYPDERRISLVEKQLGEGKITAKEYWKNYYFHTDTLLVRSNIIDRLPVKLLENNFNDDLITYSVIQYGDIYYIPKSMAIYRQTGTGIWTEGKEVINCIRHMFLYDFAMQINPLMRLETTIRCMHIWKDISEIRNKINKDTLLSYLQEADEKRLKYSKMWICYKELGFFEKSILRLKPLKDIMWIYTKHLIELLIPFEK